MFINLTLKSQLHLNMHVLNEYEKISCINFNFNFNRNLLIIALSFVCIYNFKYTNLYYRGYSFP